MSTQSTGGNNPPIPQGSQPTGAVFNGTDAGPVPLSQIAVPPAPTVQEAAPHAGVANAIDPYFYQQFVALTNFTWSTAQAPGTLLWSSAITPAEGHANLQYLARMYNIWVGGLDYQVKVAGTGFHAGALAIVRLPPNIDPASVSGVNQLSVFEYTVIDPKNLDAIMKSACDQRPVMYHYVNDQLGPNSIGGHLACYVLIQLNTSSTGTSQIDVQVFNRCSADFALLQMIPVTLPDTSPPAPTQFSELFDCPELHEEPYSGYQVGFIQARPSSEGSSFQSMELVSTQTGQYLGDRPFVEYLPTGAIDRALKYNTVAQSQFTNAAGANLFWNASFAPCNLICAGTNTSCFTVYVASSVLTGPIATQRKSFDGVDITNATNMSVCYMKPYNLTGEPTGYTFTPPVTESIVVFGADFTQNYSAPGTGLNPEVATSYALTTSYISRKFQTGKYRIPAGQAVLLQLFDKELNAPLAFLKLYPEGCFTTSARTTAISVPFRNVTLSYVGYIRLTDPVPGPTVQMASALELMHQREVTRRLEERLNAIARGEIKVSTLKIN